VIDHGWREVAEAATRVHRATASERPIVAACRSFGRKLRWLMDETVGELVR